jgi:hypothetical protein
MLENNMIFFIIIILFNIQQDFCIMQRSYRIFLIMD